MCCRRSYKKHKRSMIQNNIPLIIINLKFKNKKVVGGHIRDRNN